MSDLLTQWLQVMAVMAVGATDKTPPTRREREDVAERLDSTEEQSRLADNKVNDDTRFLENYDKGIDALQKTYDPYARQAADMMKQATQRVKDAAATLGKDDDTSAADTLKRAQEMQAQAEQMNKTLGEMKALQKKCRDDLDAEKGDSTRWKQQLQDVMKDYYQKADPRMIAERSGLAFDSNFSFDVGAEFLKLTHGGESKDWLRHFGMGAEHTWQDYYTYPKGMFYHGVSIAPMSQHEQVTTEMMHEMAANLLRQRVPGISVPVARVGMTINEVYDQGKGATALRAITGHPVDAFRPSVINNSTSAGSALEKDDVFWKRIDMDTRDENTRTVKGDSSTITYGIATSALPILGNAAGNKGWNDRVDMTMAKHFYPNHINIATAEIPAIKGGTVRDDGAPAQLEDYSSANSSVHAVIQRPRWQADGTPLKTQYLHPQFEALIDRNLWKLAGYDNPPPQDKRNDPRVCPPGLLASLEKDKRTLRSAILSKERVDANGVSIDMQGTSFAAPVANGVILAARTLYPNATPAEVIDAFCSSCVPITHRATKTDGVRQDIDYFTRRDTGKAYSPMVGYGEFVINPEATAERPDSWMKMLARLEAMEQEKKKITDNGRRKQTVLLGEGKDQRTVEINGQPVPVTIELTKGKADSTPRSRKAADKVHANVMAAFEEAERIHDLTFLEPSNEIYQHLQARKYTEARDAFRTQFVDGGLLANDNPSFQEIDNQVREANRRKMHSYTFTVQPGHDACCTNVGVRLKFADNSRTDQWVVVEDPYGESLPVSLSTSWSGVAVGSTPGFMRHSAAGEWKIHTHEELDMKDTALVISGTERNVAAGIVDVREKVLTEFEQREKAEQRLPKRNKLKPIKDPHEYLLDINDTATQQRDTHRTSPTTREEFREYLQEFLDGSELRKNNFIPEGKLEPQKNETSMLTPTRDTWGMIASMLAPQQEKAPANPFDAMLSQAAPAAKEQPLQTDRLQMLVDRLEETMGKPTVQTAPLLEPGSLSAPQLAMRAQAKKNLLA